MWPRRELWDLRFLLIAVKQILTTSEDQKKVRRIAIIHPKPNASDMLNYVRQAIAFRAANLIETTTVTSKGQITIPSRLRRELQLIEGEKVLIVREGDTLKIVPIPKLSKLAGVDEEVFKGRKPSAELETIRKEWTREFEERVRKA